MQYCHLNTPKLLLRHQKKIEAFSYSFSVLLSGEEKLRFDAS